MKSVIVGTAGHIDHGKSALVRALTGTDPDRLKEEKARGITIDLGFAHLISGDVNVAFVDVPGHERFVKNMLAGAGGIDLVMFVVAGDEGVKAQTREHFDICRMLQVPGGVVVITKIDVISASRLDETRDEVQDLVAGSFLEAAPVFPVSSRTGAGLDDLRAGLIRAATAAPGRSAGGVARLPIDRVFSMKGFGTVVTGTLVSGRINEGDELLLLPGGRIARVRGVQVHGVSRQRAAAGERVALNTTGIDLRDAERGQTLATPRSLEPTVAVDGAIELLESAKRLKHGARVRFHQGTAETLARVAIIGPPSQDGGAPSIEPGTRAFVRLRFEQPVVVTRGDRFIVRAYSPAVTIAGGEVIDPQPPRTAIRNAKAIDRSMLLDQGRPRRRADPATAGTEGSADANLAAVTLMIGEAGGEGLPISSLVSRLGMFPAAAEAATAFLAESGRAVRAGDVLVTQEVLSNVKTSVIKWVAAHHKSDPLSDGLPREEARGRVSTRCHPAVFDRALEELEGEGILAGRERLKLTAHQVALPDEQQRAREAIEAALLEAGLSPPDLSALAAATRQPPVVVDRLIKLMVRQNCLVRVDTLIFHGQALKQLKTAVSQMKSAGKQAATLDVRTFKERFGVTRKFAIPLLEYLDRERVTRRVGESRLIL